MAMSKCLSKNKFVTAVKNLFVQFAAKLHSLKFQKAVITVAFPVKWRKKYSNKNGFNSQVISLLFKFILVHEQHAQQFSIN